MSVYISGFHAIEEHLRAGTGADYVFCGPKPGPRSKAIVELARKRGIPTKTVEVSELDRLSQGADHRGVLLQVPQLRNERDEKVLDLGVELSRRSKKTNSLILALDSITDPHNLGAILRSADQFGVDLVLLPERRSVHENETVLRSSAGASAHVRTIVVGNLSRALEQCRKAGFWVIGTDMGGSPVHEFDAKRNLVLVMGSEGKGIGKLVAENCDEIVSIASRGHIDSLNVSVASGVLLYEIRRQQDFDWISD